jgi:hypothetical protein
MYGHRKPWTRDLLHYCPLLYQLSYHSIHINYWNNGPNMWWSQVNIPSVSDRVQIQLIRQLQSISQPAPIWLITPPHSCKVRQLSDLADEFDSCLTLQLAPPSGESCFRMNNYMFIDMFHHVVDRPTTVLSNTVPRKVQTKIYPGSESKILTNLLYQNMIIGISWSRERCFDWHSAALMIERTLV